jgi:hypothetical protein
MVRVLSGSSYRSSSFPLETQTGSRVGQPTASPPYINSGILSVTGSSKEKHSKIHSYTTLYALADLQ